MKVAPQSCMLLCSLSKAAKRFSLCLSMVAAISILPGCFSDSHSNSSNHSNNTSDTPSTDEGEGSTTTDCVADNMDCAP